MTRSLTVPCDSDVTMTATSELEHLCPFVDEVDHGTVTITWRADGATFELHALRDYLDAFAGTRLSHEQVTDGIRHDLSVIEGIDLVSVTSSWKTAGMGVQCSTSPTLVGQP